MLYNMFNSNITTYGVTISLHDFVFPQDFKRQGCETISRGL